MWNLLNFLIRYKHWFLFATLEAAALFLLFRYNHYQGGVFFTSANVVTGKVYDFSSKVTSYFHLKTTNDELLDKNMLLEQQVAALRNRLKEHTTDTTGLSLAGKEQPAGYGVLKAHVVNNSLNFPDNYITLDKGTSDGVHPDMGVISGTGVVGIVYMSSSSYSTVISLLNRKSNVSSKIKGSDYFGYLKWEGGNSQFAYLKDLPRHAEFSLGDTIVTSGYSAVFPEGIMVGTIEEAKDSNDGLSYLLKIKLATDFGKLNNVRVIIREKQAEQLELEKETRKE